MIFRSTMLACLVMIGLVAFQGCGSDSSPVSPTPTDSVSALVGAWSVDDSNMVAKIRFGKDSSYSSTRITEDSTGTLEYNRALGKWTASEEVIDVVWSRSETSPDGNVWTNDEMGGLLDAMIYRIEDSVLILFQDGEEVRYTRDAP